MRIRLLILASIAIALLTAVAAYSQPRFGLYAPTWEYAHAFYYQGYSIAICYGTSSTTGCRYEYLHNSGNLMRAAAVLGEDGWEHTHTTLDSYDRATMYFKRSKPAP